MATERTEFNNPVPVTLLSGFLGAGKTTLLKSILEQCHHAKEGEGDDDAKKARRYKVAVLVNDMAEINVDASLIQGTKLLETDEKLVELHNGCICCTLREDLVKSLADLVHDDSNRYDAIIVESTGVSLPREVADTFLADVSPESEIKRGEVETIENPATAQLDAIVKALRGKRTLNEVARLDTCVTMVDVAGFKANMGTAAEMREQFKDSVEKDDNRSVGPLLTQQIEFADVIVLSKCDLVSPKEADDVEDAVRALNPGARITRALRGDVPLSSVLCTGLFDMEKAVNAAGWMQLIEDEDVPETEEYGIHSFVYKARTPFHPARLAFFLNDHFFVKIEDQAMEVKTKGGERAFEVRQQVRQARMQKKFGHILRSKGCLWLAGRDHLIGGWSQAGGVGDFSCLGFWMGFLPKDNWPPEGSKQYERAIELWQGPVLQDKRQEIVFIGQNLNQEAITKALDACLIKRSETKKKDDLLSRQKAASYLSRHGTKDVDEIMKRLDQLDTAKNEEEVDTSSDYFEEHAWKLGVNYLNDPFPSWPPAELFKLAGIQQAQQS